jgi:hypothetical protein
MEPVKIQEYGQQFEQRAHVAVVSIALASVGGVVDEAAAPRVVVKPHHSAE